MSGALHAFLAGTGIDGSGRRLRDVLAFDDARIEAVHDFVQWCFPLPEASRAVPGAPILGPAEAAAIRADPEARAGLQAALDRMARFYGDTDAWLCAHDHNHLRITRIVSAARALLGSEAASDFLGPILHRNAEVGAPINPTSLAYWRRALGAG